MLWFFFGCPKTINLLGRPCRSWTIRNAVGKFWGKWSGRVSKHRETSRWFFTSAALCGNTWVLPMELGGSWCYRGLSTPCESSKSRLPDAEITRGRRFSNVIPIKLFRFLSRFLVNHNIDGRLFFWPTHFF